MEVIILLRPNILIQGLIFIVGGDLLSHSNEEKGCPACIFKHRSSFQYISKSASLFLSGRITLKVIFYYFNNYLFKIYKYPSPHFEKPTGSFIHCYRHAVLFLHLKQWCINNKADSLIQVHYAEKPRNPE